MSRKAIRAIDWAAIIERMGDLEKNQLAAFKIRSDKYLRRMAASPESPPKLDWAYYKKNISTPGLVDKFQKEYEAFSIAYPADKYTAQIDTEEKEEKKDIEQIIIECDEAIVELEKEITKINGMLPFEEMTMEDFTILYPEQSINPDKPTMWPHDRSLDEDPAETDDHAKSEQLEDEGKGDEKPKKMGH
nr:ATP synthase subunit d, mitochondrial-like [Megalopta genalis]